MHCSNCGVCCTETEMLLSKKDIKSLESRGYEQSLFVRYDRQGYAILRNRDGYCVFYNREKKCCSEYPYRPSGCRVYPVIVDEGNGIVLDSICECRGSISEAEKMLKGKRVIALLKVVDAEACIRVNYRKREKAQ